MPEADSTGIPSSLSSHKKPCFILIARLMVRLSSSSSSSYFVLALSLFFIPALFPFVIQITWCTRESYGRSPLNLKGGYCPAEGYIKARVMGLQINVVSLSFKCPVIIIDLFIHQFYHLLS